MSGGSDHWFVGDLSELSAHADVLVSEHSCVELKTEATLKLGAFPVAVMLPEGYLFMPSL